MEFKEQLTHYMELLDCSSKDLANASGLSPAAISRYRSGERFPNFESEQFQQLVKGFIQLAKEKNMDTISEETILEDFSPCFGKNAVDFTILKDNLSQLISKLNINISQMARALGFDASYISRIASGQRKPSNSEDFVNSVCRYIVKSYSQEEKKSIVANMIGISLEEIKEKETYYLKLQDWFFSNQQVPTNPVDHFLEKLDEFNLDEYIKAIHFDTLKVPTIPFHFSTSKNYYGLEEMKQGELDFFKSTVLSKTKGPIFMYNDMPMEDIANDVEFGKKWMFAIAMSLKKGLHLNMIHNLDRPFHELLLGLESWIPIYMTGQISPYYLKTPTNQLFTHTLYTSEVCALSGEGIKDHHAKAKYYVTSKKSELPYYTERAKALLKKASPLMDIYTKENNDKFESFMKKEKENKKNVILTIENQELKDTFKNIRFTLCKDKWLMITKKKAPEIHFVIYHPKLRDAIEHFVAPVVE